MTWWQDILTLAPRPRGLHLVTGEVVRGIPLATVRTGLLHLFLQHTSAALTLNENADADVRADMARWLEHAVPEHAPYYAHTQEGPDDMPAHIKSSLLGASLMLPVRDGRLLLGTWQGIWLCEFRARGGPRRIVATLQGEA
jgi:secondary thiamine-phosphate synthase enzyme